MRHYFDEALSNFEKDRPQARVLIASNIERTIKGKFNYRAKGLDSDKLDMNIYVRAVPGNFSRKLSIAVEDEELIASIEKILANNEPSLTWQQFQPPLLSRIAKSLKEHVFKRDFA